VDRLLMQKDRHTSTERRRRSPILFADVIGFTGMAERLAPEVLVAGVNAHFDLCSRVVATHDGTLDKYIGDAVMAFWNAPIEVDDHAGKALVAALEIVAVSDFMALDAARRGAATPPVRCRVGVHTGDAVVGLVGGTDRKNLHRAR